MVGAKKTLKYFFIPHSSRKISLKEVICKTCKKVNLIYNWGAFKKSEKSNQSFFISVKISNPETKFIVKYLEIQIYPEKKHPWICKRWM